MTIQIAALLIPTLVLANFPFLTKRLFGVIRLPRKTFFFEGLELLIYFILLGILAYGLERQTGQVHTQNWQFFVTVFSLFLVFAFPGFVFRYFWKTRKRD